MLYPIPKLSPWLAHACTPATFTYMSRWAKRWISFAKWRRLKRNALINSIAFRTICLNNLCVHGSYRFSQENYLQLVFHMFPFFRFDLWPGSPRRRRSPRCLLLRLGTVGPRRPGVARLSRAAWSAGRKVIGRKLKLIHPSWYKSS